MASPLAQHKLLIFIPEPPYQSRIDKLQSTYPGLQIHWERSTKPDGSLTKYDELDPKIWDGLTILCAYAPPPLALMQRQGKCTLRFVQLTSAGADKWVGNEVYADGGVRFCTSNGIHPPQIAEWVIGAWLSHQHHFPRYQQQMQRGYWEPPYSSRVQDSTGARMGILGYGAIGRQCARLASAMGMEIYAYTRTAKSTPESRKDDSYCVPGTGDPDGVLPSKWFHGSSRESVNEFLAQDLDLVVLSLPLTNETRKILSTEQFEILGRNRPGPFVVNIGRGGHVDQEALLKALEDGTIRGAAIDVTEPEPLAADHPLWKAPNLLITPHVSWLSDKYWDRILDILEINLACLSSGKSMINVVNREHHY